MSIFLKKNNFRTKEGFEAIYNEYADQMLIICYNRIKDKEIAKEIVQEIFKSLWERRSKLIIKGPIKNYLFRATKFEIIDCYRKESRKKIHLNSDLENIPIEYSSYYIDSELEYKELENELKHLISQLPPRCREVYLLSRHENLSNKEISLKLIISVKTVEAHITKALSFLQTNLEKQYNI